MSISPLLFFLILSISTATSATLSFKEAPQFGNAAECAMMEAGSDLECSEVAVHIAMTLDHSYIRGSMAAILSVLQHTSCPENTFFHLVTLRRSPDLGGTLTRSFPYLNFRLYPFDSSGWVSGLISSSIRSALDCPLNYARTYLPSLLPACLSRVVYLDSDIIAFDDISSLYNTPLGPDSVLAAPEYCSANFTAYFTPSFWSNPSLSMTFVNRRPCYFNTGVMVMELRRWREGEYTRRIEEWMELQKRMRIYELGSLPPFLLVFAGSIVGVDHRWNQHGLGGDNYKGLCRELHPGPVSLLHWSGKGKPWVRLDQGRPCQLDALWAPYDLLLHNHTTFS